MTINEIIEELSLYDGTFPRQALAEAIKKREKITPELLGILEYTAANIEEVVSQDDYMGHFYAMFLLSQFREKRAYPLLVDLVTADQTLVDKALGDVITEDLGRMLASVCGGDIGLICEMIENRNLDEYIRCAALNSLVILVVEGVKTREELTVYLKELFNGKLEREFVLVWSELVSICSDLRVNELKGQIEQAFEDDLIDLMFIRRQDVERKLAKDENEEQILAELYQDQHYHFIEDTIYELASWACFRDSEQPSAALPKIQTETQTYVRSQPKVGRNDPCPCGSGKKYKKCCAP